MAFFLTSIAFLGTRERAISIREFGTLWTISCNLHEGQREREHIRCGQDETFFSHMAVLLAIITCLSSPRADVIVGSLWTISSDLKRNDTSEVGRSRGKYPLTCPSFWQL
jgi:hypothetical protein